MAIEFCVLGPLEVGADGRVLPLGSPKQRALLGLLLVHTNETVSRDRLIDELWAEALPASDPPVDLIVRASTQPPPPRKPPGRRRRTASRSREGAYSPPPPNGGSSSHD